MSVLSSMIPPMRHGGKRDVPARDSHVISNTCSISGRRKTRGAASPFATGTLGWRAWIGHGMTTSERRWSPSFVPARRNSPGRTSPPRSRHGEAGEHSGARIQARKAVSHGRPVILTDLVVDSNKWPSDLIGRPGVHVVSSTDEIMSVVDRITAGPATVDTLLAAATRR